METLKISIKPQGAFVTALRGDTLFGQFCWALRHTQGESALIQALEGYQGGSPFAVIADPLPQGVIPRPACPPHLMGIDSFNNSPESAMQRKALKQKKWVEECALAKPLKQWQTHLMDETQLAQRLDLGGPLTSLTTQQTRYHNSLNRKTGSTGQGEGFAPFSRQLNWYHPSLSLELYVCYNAQKIAAADVLEAIEYIGHTGYGKEASNGAGKFTLQKHAALTPAKHTQANSLLTLAPSAPQGQSWQPAHCYYKTQTHFGRHGDLAAIQGQPFKNPILLAATGAVLCPTTMPIENYCGQGLGGLSKSIVGTVHQGYAPTLAIVQEGVAA